MKIAKLSIISIGALVATIVFSGDLPTPNIFTTGSVTSASAMNANFLFSFNNATGNLGIGATGPGAKLEVAGQVLRRRQTREAETI